MYKTAAIHRTALASTDSARTVVQREISNYLFGPEEDHTGIE